MRKSLFALAAVATMFAGAAQAQSANYAIDPTHTFVTFEISHFGASVNRGRFDKKEGSVQLDKAAKAGKVEISFDATSINSGNAIATAVAEVKRVVVGQDRLVERSFVCLLANGHCLIEGVPGLAKTLTVSTMAQVVGGQFSRIQFTPDLVPADVVGTRIWRPSREEFDIEWGAVFGSGPEALTQVALDQEGGEFAKRLKSIIVDVFGLRAIPTSVLVPMELWANQSQFTGRPIVSEAKERLDPALQYGPQTSLAARNAGELLDVSPAKIDHAIRGYLGTLGTYSVMLADQVWACF